MPPVLLLSDASENLFYGMFHHPFFESTHRILDALRSTAQMHLTLFELDGATGNERLYNYFLGVERHGPLIEMIKCRNHQTNLVEGSLVLTASPPGHNLLSLFFSFTHFIRTGGHWVRLKQAVRDWIGKTATIRTHICGNYVRKVEWEHHVQEVKGFLLSTERLKRSISNLSTSLRSTLSAPSGDDDSVSNVLRQKVDEFFVS